MMRHLKLTGTILFLFIFIIPFQNCSIYKSEGRKVLEEQGQALIDAASSGISQNKDGLTFGKLTRTDCLPFLSTTKASDFFSQSPMNLKLFYDEGADKLTCLISIESESSNGIETAICSISP